ncbi:MAG: alanine racemase [Alphaproteobacteria bacterium]|jgi:predicted amino acid racemase|nr:alanine racemase [Alphaproteobacteria bacterium]
MFLHSLITRNKKFINTVQNFYNGGLLEPDTYVIDMDALLQNAQHILNAAQQNNIELFFITKQLGFNPVIARELVQLGYGGAVCVDFREADRMLQNNIPLKHCGHLVQIPKLYLEKIVPSVEYITVYSLAKAQEINTVAESHKKIQKIFLKVYNDGDTFYLGQYGGFHISELPILVAELRKLSNIEIAGLTTFPAFLYNSNSKKIEPTPNVATMQQAKAILEELGIKIDVLNMPSSTCVANMSQTKALGGNQAEVGHGLTGTTPLHAADFSQPEIPAILYLSETSHNWGGKSYFYGGGYYARSHLKNALVGDSLKMVEKFPDDTIDYYLNLQEEVAVSRSVITCFRTQIFTTRSKVVLVSGVQECNPKIVGVYSSLGEQL